MAEEESSYRKIMKATALFGGVQVYNIIISIVRTKFIAILLGPSGMGIMGLLQSSLGLIAGFTNFGLETSAVKDISAANKSKDYRQIGLVVTVIRRLVWITGILGSLSVIFLSSWLSQLTFGNKDYTLAFIWISITLLFSQLSNGQLVILQGLQKLRYLAIANLLGSTLGLFVTIPLYYLWGVDGIVPGIISTSVISLLLSWIYSRKVKIISQKITIKETIGIGRNMMQMGFVISLGGLASILGGYLIQIFISQTGGVAQVGLYVAGYSMIHMYTGIILKGMATDYYPRLSAVADDDRLFKQTINKQTEIGLLIIAPLLIIFIVFINLIVPLLYSKQFIGINDMLVLAALGMFFRVPGWSLGFVFLAKGESAIYFYLQLLSHILLLVLNIAGYYLWGLTGVGIAMMILYPIYLLVVYKINNKKIKFTFDKSSIKLFALHYGLAIIACISILNFDSPYNFIIGIAAILASVYHSINLLNKRLELLHMLKKYFKTGK